MFATHLFHVSPPQNWEEFQNYVSYLKEFRVTIGPTGVSSLRVTVSCTRLEDLEELWRAYTTGALNEAAEKYLVTDAVLRQYNLKELRLTTFIDEEEYRRCKEQLVECEGTVTMRATFSQTTCTDSVVSFKNVLYFVVLHLSSNDLTIIVDLPCANFIFRPFTCNWNIEWIKILQSQNSFKSPYHIIRHIIHTILDILS